MNVWFVPFKLVGDYDNSCRKAGKGCLDSGNYRPIAFISYLYKTLKPLVNERLAWFLETKMEFQYHSGLRKQCSTRYQLVRLESFVREAFSALNTWWRSSPIWSRPMIQREITAFCEICTTLMLGVACLDSYLLSYSADISDSETVLVCRTLTR